MLLLNAILANVEKPDNLVRCKLAHTERKYCKRTVSLFSELLKTVNAIVLDPIIDKDEVNLGAIASHFCINV